MENQNLNILEGEVKLWCNKLNTLLQANISPLFEKKVEFTIQKGKRYWKVVQSEIKENKTIHENVHAFLEVGTGNIYKPASWKAPAKHARFNIFQHNFLECVSDPHGGYLYLNR